MARWHLFVALLAGCARYQVELLDVAPPVGPARCQGHVCACVNGLDDDGDGAADGLDDACTGALDDDETSLGTSVESGASCLDCFFDANEGGDEGCRYPASCRVDGAPGGGCGGCGPDAACADACRPLVPNGCDCFGCCVVETASGPISVVLAEGCSAATLDDAIACPRCMPSPWCVNRCERCEICPGRPAPPADCAPSCGDGEQPCAASSECGADQACVLGCCIAAPR